MKDIEDALRDSLARRAGQAPDGAALAEHIAARAEGRAAGRAAPARTRRRDWRTWMLPLVSAGAVAAVVGAVLGINAATKPDARPAPPANSTTAPPAPTVANDGKVLSASFTGPNSGWALVQPRCPDGGLCPLPVTAVVHTDGSGQWRQVGTVDLPNDPQLDFVDDRTGFAWGPNRAFRTQDGGATWQPIRLSGLDHLVVASGQLIGTDEDGAVYRLAGTTMKPTGTQLHNGSFHNTLETDGTSAYWVGYPHYIASEGPEHTTFSVSTDGGTTWKERTVECPGKAPQGDYLDASELHFAPDGAIVANCDLRYATRTPHSVIAVSTDGGKSFDGGDALDGMTLEAAASDKILFAYATKNFSAARSTDAGKTWQPIPSLDGLMLTDDSQVRFDTSTDGWLIDAGGALWLTHDAGATWTRSLGQATPSPKSVPPAPTTSAPTPPPSSPTGSNPPPRMFDSVSDMSVAGDDIWVLGGTQCAAHPGSPCAVLEHSSDDGASWKATNVPADAAIPGSEGCVPACVTRVRFANSTVGYLYDDQTAQANLFMTTDGGNSWRKLDGGAAALETLDNNVIRVVGHAPGCSLKCTYTVVTADVGSSDWSSPAPLPGPQSGGHLDGVVRAPGVAYALVQASDMDVSGHFPESVLSRSTDGGRTWINLGEPCPDGRGEDVTAGADGSAFVYCGSTTITGHVWGTVYRSTDRGEHFSRVDGITPNDQFLRFTAGDRDHLCVVAPALRCTANGGRTWTPAKEPTAPIWLGFQSRSDVRALTYGDTSTLWTSHDGGQHWTSSPITG